MQTIQVVIKVEIEDGFDAQEVISNCDYSLTGEGIGDTEIIAVFDKDEDKVF